jgi:hypothetical protein
MGEIGSDCKVKRSSQLDNQIGCLGASIERALALKSDVESRLSCVLRSDTPIQSLEKTKEPVSLVPLATTISEFNLKMDILNSRLESILNRIEL